MNLKLRLKQLFCKHDVCKTEIIDNKFVDVCVRCKHKKIIGSGQSRRDFLKTITSAIVVAPIVNNLKLEEQKKDDYIWDDFDNPYIWGGGVSIGSHRVYDRKCFYCQGMNKNVYADTCEFCNAPRKKW